MTTHSSWALEAALAGRLDELTENLPTLNELGVTPEMMEAAEEIAAGADGECIERWRLQVLVRALLYLAGHREEESRISLHPSRSSVNDNSE